MSKQFKGKTCVYCATPGISDTGDHVLSREFVAEKHRPQIPKVPACRACNGDKAALEHYATAILPFGGRHADAAANLVDNVPRRLARNQKLQRALAAGRSRIWSKEPSGDIVHAVALPVDGKKLEKLVGLIVRGLMFHHWGVVLGPDCFVDVHSLTAHGEAFFEKFGALNAKQRIEHEIGEGALVYKAAQGIDNPRVSLWEISLYGEVKMTGDNDEDSTSKFGVMTGPNAVKDRAEERLKRNAPISG